jgi:integrase
VNAVPHGFRSSFRDWAAEQTSAERDVIEACLAHAVGSEVELAYRRTDFLEKRRKLMTDWGAFCADAEPKSKVVKFPGFGAAE